MDTMNVTEHAATRIRALSDSQALALAAALCERMLPNYGLYTELTGQGDMHRVRVMMDLIWEQLGPSQARIDFERQSEKLEELEPDIDHDDSLGARLALETTMALSSCFDGLQKSRPIDSAMEVAQLSSAGVARFLELSRDADDDADLTQEPLMQDEQAFLEAVLDQIEAGLDQEQLKAVKRLARNDGVSNVGVAL
ncbi:YjaG family protein [Larsenimonas salina]|uniref:YjaG family protein n=1 Tax=Larsenimonas salina TaxID=1295565 RepID=UPI00207431E0|nr:DUF416 family protein [Larsenimonas salina]MCM5705203.1 YjaG family protein [Larsenimonas salina]